MYEGQLLFGLGRDSKTHEFTDFGGKISYSHDRTPATAALREFHEESLNIIKGLRQRDLGSFIALYDEENFIIFVHLKVDPNEVCHSFHQAYQKFIVEHRHEKWNQPEMCGITWFTIDQMSQLIQQTGFMFERVRRVLAEGWNVRELL